MIGWLQAGIVAISGVAALIALVSGYATCLELGAVFAELIERAVARGSTGP